MKSIKDEIRNKVSDKASDKVWNKAGYEIMGQVNYEVRDEAQGYLEKLKPPIMKFALDLIKKLKGE